MECKFHALSQILSISFHTSIFIEVNETIHMVEVCEFWLLSCFGVPSMGSDEVPRSQIPHSFWCHDEAVLWGKISPMCRRTN